MWWDNRRRLRLWEDAVASCEVDAVEASDFWDWQAQLTARSGPLEVRITDAHGGGDGVAVVVEGAEGFSGLKLRRHLKLNKREIEVGDEAFDKAFLVEGPLPPVAVRLLDGTLRGQLLRAGWACDVLEIGDGRLRVEVSEEDLPRILPILFSISRRFAEPLNVKSQLLHNARRDPNPAVRLFNLLVLIREYPGDPDTLKVLRGACIDPISKVRVRAAIALGDEARDVVLRVAEKSSDDASCALAVSTLGSELPLERVHDILSRARRKRFLQTARACLDVLGQRGAEAMDTLARVMNEEEGELATAAALALGAAGGEVAEPLLFQALQSEEGDLQEAAVAALGKFGTAAAVQPLQEAAEGSRLDSKIRGAARQAIAEIQARLVGAAPGQLSLASSEAGQLSLAAEAGQLSLSPEEAP